MTKFGTVIADPPWEYAATSKTKMPTKGSAKLSGYSDEVYPSMTTDDLCALPVADLVTNEAVLLLWTSFPHMPAALRIIPAWGFTYVTGLVWVKTTRSMPPDLYGGIGDIEGTLAYGVGYWFRGCAELVLVGKRGKSYRTNERSVFIAPVMGHSRKPDDLHEMAEKHLQGPRLEVFARRERVGWTCAGNECPSTKGQDIRESLARLVTR